MRLSRMRLPCTLGPAVGVITVLATLAIATPATAAGNDYKGWFAALDLATTQPNSLDQHFANHVDTTVTPSPVERLVMDNDSDFTYRASVGYSWGKSRSSALLSRLCANLTGQLRIRWSAVRIRPGAPLFCDLCDPMDLLRRSPRLFRGEGIEPPHIAAI